MSFIAFENNLPCQTDPCCGTEEPHIYNNSPQRMSQWGTLCKMHLLTTLCRLKRVAFYFIFHKQVQIQTVPFNGRHIAHD